MSQPASEKNVVMICPNLKCRKVLQVPAQFRGQRVKCHYCNTTFGVPLAKPNEPKAAAKAPAKDGADS